MSTPAAPEPSPAPAPTRAEALRLRTQVAELTAQLAQTQWRLAALQARRSVRISEAYGQGRGGLSGLRAARGELKRSDEPPPPPQSDPTAELQARLRAARRAREGGDLPGARAAVDELLAVHPFDLDVLDLDVDLRTREGDLPGAYRVALTLARIDDTARLRARRTRIAGRLRALDPRFAPYVAPRQGPRGRALLLHVPAAPPEPGAVAAFCAVLGERLRAASVPIAAVAPLGSDRTGGTDHDVLGGVPLQRPDPGRAYPVGGPQDAVLTDEAALLADLADSAGVCALAVVSCSDRPERGIVALAAGRACHVPVVAVAIDVGHDTGTTLVGVERELATLAEAQVLRTVERVVAVGPEASARARAAGAAVVTEVNDAEGAAAALALVLERATQVA